MCGFVGYIHGSTAWNHQTVIEGMMNRIVHRGPDSGGMYSDDKVTLGFRRLSIIDLSDNGKQPMYSADGNLVLVFNGEIFNFQELREDLKQKGHIFHSKTDSEVLIYGYKEYGYDFVKQLRGMFAFAIWDKVNDTMFIARDGFGIKPLYYTTNTTDGSLLFGSEIKSFLAHPAFIKEVNKDALRPYLTLQYSSMGETFFKGVHKLKPAHYMVLKGNDIHTVEYWDKKFHAENGTLESYVEEVKATMADSVRAHKISDVKTGAFLSGGVDSSLVTALMKPEKSFSVGFSEYEKMFNETNQAADLSEILGIENVRKYISPEEAFHALPTIQYHMDEPQSNPSSVPLYFLAELAKKDVTVVLSGEGADEIFGGYSWYEPSKKMETYEKVPYSLRKGIGKLAHKLPKNTLTTFLVKGGQKVEERFIGQAIVWDEEEAVDILKPAYKNGPDIRSITKPIYDEVKGQDDVTKMQYLDLNLWMPGDILLKADKMSMANSLELRVPFLDRKVFELASHIPTKCKVNANQTKIAMRGAAEKTIPAKTADKKKLGFPVPVRAWLRDEQYAGVVRKAFNTPAAEQFFRTKELNAMLDQHISGKRDNWRQIWCIFMFLVWYDEYFVKR